MNLPSPIQAYFDANARLDPVAMLAPFSAEAVVRDEGGVHRGTEAIGAWIAQASLQASAIARPRTIRSEAGLHEVTAEVSGRFPGSPIALSFRFRVEQDAIAQLEIG